LPIWAEVILNAISLDLFVVVIEEVHANFALREWNCLVSKYSALWCYIVDKLIELEFAISWIVENILTPEI